MSATVAAPARATGRAASRPPRWRRRPRPAVADHARRRAASGCSSTRRRPTSRRTSTAPTSSTPTGLGIWEQGWYAGHHLPGYSVLFPPLAALLSPQLVAARVRASLAAWCFERLARGWWPAPAATRRVDRGSRSASSRRSSAGSSRSPPASAPALGALLAASRGRRALARGAGRRDDADEPGRRGVPRARLRGVVARRRARARALCCRPRGALVPGPRSIAARVPAGRQRSRSRSRRSSGRSRSPSRSPRCCRRASACCASARCSTPRALVAGDRHRHAARRQPRAARRGLRRPAARSARCGNSAGQLLLAARRPLLYWQWLAPVRSVIRGARRRRRASSPTTSRCSTSSTGARAAEGPFRTEIPFTADHWETRYVAPRRPLARGWERQLDVKLNRLFYERRRAHAGAATALARPRRRSRYVALPRRRSSTRPARARARSCAPGAVPGLREVWRGGDWRLYRVEGDRPLAQRARARDADRLDGVTLHDPAPGDDASCACASRRTGGSSAAAAASARRPAAGRACGSTSRQRALETRFASAIRAHGRAARADAATSLRARP